MCKLEVVVCDGMPAVDPRLHDFIAASPLAYLNNRRKGTFPKEMTITIRSTTKSTRNRQSPNFIEKETIPNTTNHNATMQSLISFSNMRRIKELQRAMNIQQRTTTKTLTTTKISTPNIKDSSPKMLNRTRQITKRRKTRPSPSKSKRIPPKTNLRSTSQKKMDRTMSRTTLANQIQKTMNPTDLSRPKSKIPTKQTKLKPNHAKKAGSHPEGPSNKLRTAPTLAKG